MTQFPTSRNRGGYDLPTRPESPVLGGLLDSHVDGELTANLVQQSSFIGDPLPIVLDPPPTIFFDLVFGFHEFKKGIHFTIKEPARRDHLRRLLKLNHERYAEEVRQGLHGKKGAGSKSAAVRVASGGERQPVATKQQRRRRRPPMTRRGPARLVRIPTIERCS